MFQKVSDLMKSAEKYSGPMPYKKGCPFSLELKNAALECIQIKKTIRLQALDIRSSKYSVDELKERTAEDGSE